MAGSGDWDGIPDRGQRPRDDCDEFQIRWRTLDYNRLSYQGATVMPPEGVQGGPRPVYGRNGKGRQAAFYFSSPYRVRMWKDGVEVVYQVSRGISNPIDLVQEKRRECVTGHGTEISALASNLPALSAADEVEAERSLKLHSTWHVMSCQVSVRSGTPSPFDLMG